MKIRFALAKVSYSERFTQPLSYPRVILSYTESPPWSKDEMHSADHLNAKPYESNALWNE